jgi:hypothetical protein
VRCELIRRRPGLAELGRAQRGSDCLVHCYPQLVQLWVAMG